MPTKEEILLDLELMNNWFDIMLVELWINKPPSEWDGMRSIFAFEDADKSKSDDDVFAPATAAAETTTTQQKIESNRVVYFCGFSTKQNQIFEALKSYFCLCIFFSRTLNKFKLPDASEKFTTKLSRTLAHLSSCDRTCIQRVPQKWKFLTE